MTEIEIIKKISKDANLKEKINVVQKIFLANLKEVYKECEPITKENLPSLQGKVSGCVRNAYAYYKKIYFKIFNS